MYTRSSRRSNREFNSCVPLTSLETASVSNNARSKKNAEKDIVILESGESEAGCLCLMQNGSVRMSLYVTGLAVPRGHPWDSQDASV